MVTKADLETKIGEIATVVTDGFGALNTTLQNEIQQVIDAINNGGDLSSTLTALETLKTTISDNIGNLQTGISNIVTPPSA